MTQTTFNGTNTFSEVDLDPWTPEKMWIFLIGYFNGRWGWAGSLLKPITRKGGE